MNNKFSFEDTIVLIIFCIVCGLVGFVIGGNVGVKGMETIAIHKGYAHYTVNPTNGQTKFEWKTK